MSAVDKCKEIIHMPLYGFKELQNVEQDIWYEIKSEWIMASGTSMAKCLGFVQN